MKFIRLHFVGSGTPIVFNIEKIVMYYPVGTENESTILVDTFLNRKKSVEFYVQESMQDIDKLIANAREF